MEKFNDDFIWWFSCQMELFKDNDVQKTLYEIETEHLPNFGNITEREKTILKEVVSLSLRLSFILEYYPEEAGLLINNISSYYGRLQGNHQGAIPEVL